MDTTFWIALAGIVWVDLLLSGDNAVVIALVCRQLPKKKQTLGMLFGTGVAVALRIVFAIFAATLIAIPGLSIAGAAFLLYVAVNLASASEGGGIDHKPSLTLLSAISTIALADASMSLDNVIAIAALAGGDWLLMALGVALSIPLVIAGSAVISTIVDRFPVMKWAGAGLLGWVSGGILAGDSIVAGALNMFNTQILHLIFGLSGAAIVIVGGLAVVYFRPSSATA